MWADVGAGRVDVVFQLGTTIVLLDLLSGGENVVPNARFLQAAANYAAMGFRVFCIRSGYYPYTSFDGTHVPARMDATPPSVFGSVSRSLYLTLNLIVPMLTGDPNFRPVIIPAGFIAGAAAILNIPVYRAFLRNFPLLDLPPALRRHAGAPAGTFAAVPPAIVSRLSYWNGLQMSPMGIMYYLLREGLHGQSRIFDIDANFGIAVGPNPISLASNVVASLWNAAVEGPIYRAFAPWHLAPVRGFVDAAFPAVADFLGNAAYAALIGRNPVPQYRHPAPANSLVPLFASLSFSRIVVNGAAMVGALPVPTPHAPAGAAALVAATAATDVSYLA